MITIKKVTRYRVFDKEFVSEKYAIEEIESRIHNHVKAMANAELVDQRRTIAITSYLLANREELSSLLGYQSDTNSDDDEN